MSTKRPRSDNFSKADRLLLSNLIIQELDIIESKSSTHDTALKKVESWRRVTELFNATSSSQRTTKQLNVLWRNMKVYAKKEASERKRLQKRTGGGPAPPELSSLTQVIVDALPQDFRKPNSEFDGER